MIIAFIKKNDDSDNYSNNNENNKDDNNDIYVSHYGIYRKIQFIYC